MLDIEHIIVTTQSASNETPEPDADPHGGHILVRSVKASSTVARRDMYAGLRAARGELMGYLKVGDAYGSGNTHDFTLLINQKTLKCTDDLGIPCGNCSNAKYKAGTD